MKKHTTFLGDANRSYTLFFVFCFFSCVHALHTRRAALQESPDVTKRLLIIYKCIDADGWRRPVSRNQFFSDQCRCRQNDVINVQLTITKAA